MPIAECTRCGGTVHWSWEEAFDKFGFGDGDRQIMTDDVISALEHAGYTVAFCHWGLHNQIITAISKDGISQIPEGANVGYDDPRDYLPQEIVDLLDKAFPEEVA